MPHAASPTTASPPSIAGKHLYVNDGLLAPDEVLPLRPSSPTEPIDTLRERFRADGYLFLKGVIPRADVLQARQDYFEMFEGTGMLKAGTTAREGIFNDTAVATDFPGIGAGTDNPDGRPGDTPIAANFTQIALDAHTAEWYIGSADGSSRPGFAKHPAIRDFVARFTDWGDDTLTVKRTILRNNCPGNKAVGVHYDQIFMRYGEPTAMTAWVPMGDIALEGGGLIYLQDGEAIGTRIEEEFAEKARTAGLTDEEMRSAFNRNMMSTGFLCEGPKEFSAKHGGRWLVAEYEAGDIVLHSPHQIHASTLNTDPSGTIRLGTDLRYVNSARRWDTRWNNHFVYGDGV